MNWISTYGGSLSLLTDLYELTMAYGYWKSGMQDWESVFHLTFRRQPFGGGFSVACGLQFAIDWIQSFHFREEDINYLSTLKSYEGSPLFEADFLKYLQNLKLSVDVDAVPEGTAVFPHEPLIRIRGPLLQCQLLETILLNFLGFQTLIATKAARIKLAALGDPVLEFGARRAQGVDGAVSASRAAYVGGCDATSNVLAGKLFGIPVQGTHAHSWVMAFDSEWESFEAYAKTMPNNVIFLVDTYNTAKGIDHAIQIGLRLKAQGHELWGIRLDSGDLDALSREARTRLDDEGLQQTKILGTNDLDETLITSLKQQGSKISVWGVGTQLVTAGADSSLGVVYKLSAIRKPGEKNWLPRLKLSEQPAKISLPGTQQIRRFKDGPRFIADTIYDETIGFGEEHGTPVLPTVATQYPKIGPKQEHTDLLTPIFRSGRLVYQAPSLEQIRLHQKQQMEGLSRTVKRFINPQVYPVGLDIALSQLRASSIERARGNSL